METNTFTDFSVDDCFKLASIKKKKKQKTLHCLPSLPVFQKHTAKGERASELAFNEFSKVSNTALGTFTYAILFNPSKRPEQ